MLSSCSVSGCEDPIPMEDEGYCQEPQEAHSWPVATVHHRAPRRCEDDDVYSSDDAADDPPNRTRHTFVHFAKAVGKSIRSLCSETLRRLVHHINPNCPFASRHGMPLLLTAPPSQPLLEWHGDSCHKRKRQREEQDENTTNTGTRWRTSGCTGYSSTGDASLEDDDGISSSSASPTKTGSDNDEITGSSSILNAIVRPLKKLRCEMQRKSTVLLSNVVGGKRGIPPQDGNNNTSAATGNGAAKGDTKIFQSRKRGREDSDEADARRDDRRRGRE